MPNTKFESFKTNYLALSKQPQFLYCGLLSNEEHWQVKRHKHVGSCEIVLVAEGTGYTQIGEDAHGLAPGDLILYNEGVFHSESFHAPGGSLKVFSVVMQDLAVEHLPPNHLIPGEVVPVLASGPELDVLRELFEQIVEECGAQGPGYEMAVNGMVQALLVKVLRLVNDRYRLLRTGGDLSLGDRIKAFIEERYTQALTLKSIAEHFGLSHYYLEHAFKAYQGSSAIAYLIAYRLRMAKKLLETSDLSVKVVAAMAGYESASNFSVSFKKATGMTASDYRARHKAAPAPGHATTVTIQPQGTEAPGGRPEL